MHHQQYAIRPRPRWPLPARLLLWAMVLMLGACVVSLALPALLRRPVRLQVIESPANAGPEQPGVKRFRYHVSAPPGHKVTFWAELWKDGAVRPLPGFSHTQTIVPARDQAFDGYVELSMEEQEATARLGQARWTWKFNSSQGNASKTAWVPDPFLGMKVRDASWIGVNQWNLGPGHVHPLLIVRGDKDRLDGRAGDPNIVRDADVEVTLKCRLDAVYPGEQHDRVQYGASQGRPNEAQMPGDLGEEGHGEAEEHHGAGERVTEQGAEGVRELKVAPSTAPADGSDRKPFNRGVGVDH